MKKLTLLIAAVAMLGLSSCSTVYHTSKALPVSTEIMSRSTADLQVSPNKISYKYVPTKAVRRAGERNVISTAVAEALAVSGHSDVLVSFDYEIKKTRNIFGITKIKYVIVEGYPAIYTNIKPLEAPICHGQEH